MTPSSGAVTVVSTLLVTFRSPMARATSVKVPPISTASRMEELLKMNPRYAVTTAVAHQLHKGHT
jgi:hypothetical protein